MKKINYCYPIIFLTSVAFSFAQKLPNKQEKGILLPANLKINGVSDEWQNNYQAYNHGTEIYYTIANDDDNLYLSIHATKSQIIEKMMEGGVSFALSSGDKINDNKDFTILFPLLKIQDCRNILRAAGKTLSEGPAFGPPPNKDSILAEKKRTFSIAKANELLNGALKEIKIAGAPAITDTIPGITPKTPYYSSLPLRYHNFKVIPLANHDGIKAATRFDSEGAYTYEILIPMKLAKLSINSNSKISYKITLNARGEDARRGNSWWYTHTKPQEMMYMDLETKSDFSGKYTLAK